jgi:hypothetical protein
MGVDNLASSSEELGPDRQLASRDLVMHLLDALKPRNAPVIDRSFAEIAGANNRPAGRRCKVGLSGPAN